MGNHFKAGVSGGILQAGFSGSVIFNIFVDDLGKGVNNGNLAEDTDLWEW